MPLSALNHSIFRNQRSIPILTPERKESQMENVEKLEKSWDCLRIQRDLLKNAIVAVCLRGDGVGGGSRESTNAPGK